MNRSFGCDGACVYTLKNPELCPGRERKQLYIKRLQGMRGAVSAGSKYACIKRAVSCEKNIVGRAQAAR